MDSNDSKVDFTDVIDTAMSLFGEVMSREAISTIVGHYGGDLNQSIEAIVNMSEDKGQRSEHINVHLTPYNQATQADNQPTNNFEPHDMAQALNAPTTCTIAESSQSYSAASQSKTIISKRLIKPITNTLSKWDLQIKQVIEYHNQGHRIMILMRGLPGSGKSHLAKQLVQTMCPGAVEKTHIFSSDDYFMVRGEYRHDKSRLPDAHNWNHNRVQQAAFRGLSPIFVDNTHVKIWEMEPYVKIGVFCGYIIEVLEPNTPWAKKANQCANKNTHNVPFYAIKRMLENYEDVVSGVSLIRMNGLSYPADRLPPVMRNFPPVMTPQQLAPDQNPSTSSELPSKISVPTDTKAVAIQNLQTQNTLMQVIDGNQNQQVPAVDITKSQSMLTLTHVDTTDVQNQQKHVVNITPATSSDIKEINLQTQNTLMQVIDGNQNQQVPAVDITKSQSMLTLTHVDTTDVQNQQKHVVNITPATSSDIKEIKVASADKSGANGDNPAKEPDGDDVALTPEAIEKLRKQFEEIERLDQEWENGENWDDNSESSDTPRKLAHQIPSTPQPPRRIEASTIDPEKFLPSAFGCNDWSKISMFLPPWTDHKTLNAQVTPTIPIETASVSTSVEYGDTDTNSKNLKILIATPKDINFYYMGPNEEKIPNKRMLDKSTTTNDHDHIATKRFRCHNEERHFDMVTKMFPSISSDYLRDVFDKCLGDVNWAVNIIFDSVKNEDLPIIIPNTTPDSEHLDEEPCDCLAAYNIIPNVNTQPVLQTAENIQVTSEVVAGPSTSKIKKEKTVLESSLLLKRQIEQNVVISDNHYSQHCLKLRKMRRGEECNYSRGDAPQDETEATSATAAPKADTVTDSTLCTDEDSQTSSSDDCERTVNVDLGSVFVSELDDMFGRHDMYYPENVVTRVNMPVSLLNEVNALWMESLMDQLEQQSRQSELMLRQDEEFARQLALKEEELARAGQEPAIPDLKEIMDMELALSIYKKEITAEWRNNVPNDLAARMTREKLYNLFPDVIPETLSELLMAHDNNFNATVEVLLSSTGNTQILEEENGVAKFIAKKELERQKKILEEEKKALSEVEWPLLPKEVKVDMKMVQDYRAQANQFLSQRNLYYHKAQEFFRRDMTDVATYYSDVAGMHKRKFELANSLAAASLMQVHATNSSDNATIDLHFLHVPEAKESLDLFLDTHIQKLRELQSKGPAPRFHNLFFITGRGLHSHGGPKIKPAMKRRLRERGISFSERNPGLLASKVCADDKMTYELP